LFSPGPQSRGQCPLTLVKDDHPYLVHWSKSYPLPETPSQTHPETMPYRLALLEPLNPARLSPKINQHSFISLARLCGHYSLQGKLEATIFQPELYYKDRILSLKKRQRSLAVYSLLNRTLRWKLAPQMVLLGQVHSDFLLCQQIGTAKINSIFSHHFTAHIFQKG
jgi:hypothetical protein